MEGPLPVETEDDLRAEVADLRRLLALGATTSGVRDELFCQICKQIEGNPDPISTERGWFLLALCLATFSPSEKLLHYVENYVINATPAPAVQALCLRLLARDARREARAHPLALAEWFAVRVRAVSVPNIAADDACALALRRDARSRRTPRSLAPLASPCLFSLTADWMAPTPWRRLPRRSARRPPSRALRCL